MEHLQSNRQCGSHHPPRTRAGRGMDGGRGLFLQGAHADSLVIKGAYTWTATSSSTMIGTGTTTRCPAYTNTTYAKIISTNIPLASILAPTSSGSRRPTTWTTRTAPRLTPMRCLACVQAGSKVPIPLYIDGRNLTDRRYIASASITDYATASSALFEPGTGRSVFAGVQIQY